MARHAHALREGRTETRDRILAVACELFSRHGYQGTTIRMIADGARLTDPAVYYYFATKRELHNALLVEPLIDTPLPATSDFECAIGTLAEFFTRYAASSNLARLAFREQISGTPAGIQFLRDNVATSRRFLGPFFRQYYGETAAEMEDIAIAMLCGLFWDAILRHGDNFEAVVRAEAFQQRLRQLIRTVLPQMPVGAQ